MGSRALQEALYPGISPSLHPHTTAAVRGLASGVECADPRPCRCHVGAQFLVTHDSLLPQVHASCRYKKFY
jgi:hypothetical protein